MELKGSVFRKFDKNNLFQLSCSDVRERFHLTMLLLAVSLQTMKEYAWRSDRLAVLLPDCIMLWIAEIIVDWVSFKTKLICQTLFSVHIIILLFFQFKHAFITRFNAFPSTVYREYTVSLAYDMAQTRQETAFSDPSDLVARRMGFIPLPLSVAIARVLCTTLTPSLKPANIILVIFGYLILVTLRIFISIVILGRACDIISSHLHNQALNKDKDDKSTKDLGARDSPINNDPKLATAILSNSSVNLNSPTLNENVLSDKSCDINLLGLSKSVIRAGSEPLLHEPQ